MATNWENIKSNELLISWLLILGNSLASVLGASFVYLDLLFKNQKNSTDKWIKFGWPLSGGILFYSTQFSLLPHTYEHLQKVDTFKNYPLLFLILFYVSGLLLTLFLSRFVTSIAPKAIHGCEHNHGEGSRKKSEEFNIEDDELTLMENDILNEDNIELEDRNFTISTDNSYHHSNIIDEEMKNISWKIAIQTAIAISCHKLPEGLIMIMRNSAGGGFGLSIFIGLFIHNIPEGFTLAIPMLMMTGSRAKAFLFAAAVGGLCQPIGGFIGTLLMGTVDPSSFMLMNGVVLGMVSGMMLTVIIECGKSIYQSYRKKNQDFKYLALCFLVGFIVMLIIGTIVGHDDDD